MNSTIKLSTIIIDDEQDARSLLKGYLANYPYIQLISEVNNGIDAVTEINERKPDLVFLDMQMPGLNGLQVLEKLVHSPRIVFNTAFDSYAISAFEKGAFDYLLKPYTKERIDKTMLRLLTKEANDIDQNISLLKAIEYPHKRSTQFLVEIGGKMINLQTNEIIWLEAKGNYTLIHTLTKTYLSKYGISDLGTKFPQDTFIRIHRSKIINLNYIREVYRTISGLSILLANDTLHKVSRSYLDDIRWFIL